MKRIMLVLLAIAVCAPLSGCWSSHEVNSLAISVCVGIDKGPMGFLISEQVINPRSIASMKATNESPVTVYSTEGENLQETIARMSTISSRKIYSSHLRMVIISEDVAKSGLEDIVDYMVRYHEYRTDFFFAVARGATAREILSLLTPIEAIPGIALFERLKMSHEEWAPAKGVKIIELANDIAVEGINPVITGVEIIGDQEKTTSTGVLTKTGGYDKLSFSNLAAFKKDKLVGWLNEMESKGYNYITNNVVRTSGFSGNEEGVELTYDVLKATSKIKASVKDNQPKIDVSVKIKYNIIGVKGNLDVSKLENVEKINKLAAEKLENMCNMTVEKAKKDLKSDIFGFGERIHAVDSKYWKTVKENWNDVFVNMPVNVKVTADVIGTGDITKTLKQKG